MTTRRAATHRVDLGDLPPVSVVIPVRDDAPALERALADLAAQTYPPAEIVVVDNASTDRTAEVASSHGARVVPEEILGVPAAAAAGYDAATHHLIARCDADSRLPADWVERIATAFARDPRLDALTGPGRFYDLPGRLAPFAPAVSALYLGGLHLGTGAAMASVPLWGSNMAMRAAAWRQVRDRVHRDDPLVHDDLDLAMALGPQARIRYDRDLRVLVQARILRPGGLRRQVDMGMHTLRRGWAEDLTAGLRWVARVRQWRTPPTEQVVLLDPAGHAIGTTDKAGVHHADTPLHLAFSCYVTDGEGRVLLTRRARDKATFPGVVTNTACGHPAPGESQADAVRRRCRDELGLEVREVTLVLADFAYRAEMDGVVELEQCPVHRARVDPGTLPRLDPTEVADAQWVEWPRLRDEVLRGERTVSSWCAEQVERLADLPDDPLDWPAADPADLPPAARVLQ